MKYYGLLFEFLLTITACKQENTIIIKDQLALKKLVNTFSNLIDTKNVAKQVLQFTKDASVTYFSNGNQKIMTIYGIRYDDDYLKQDEKQLIYVRKSKFLWEDSKT